MVVLTFSVGCYYHFSLSGFPRTFIIEWHYRLHASMCKHNRSFAAGEHGLRRNRKGMFDSFFTWLRFLPLRPCSARNGSRRYSGCYLDGKAVYYYDEAGDERIYEGKFCFTRTYYSHQHGKVADSAAGRFRHGMKNGKWIIRRRRRGERRVLVVDYADGIHNGLYSYKSVCRSHSSWFRDDDTWFFVLMRDGLPVGETRGDFGGEIFTGRFDEEGRPDGVWKMDLSGTSACRIDCEVWEHGIRKETYTINSSTGVRSASSCQISAFIISFVYRECLPMETLVEKGSSVWKGNVRHCR